MKAIIAEAVKEELAETVKRKFQLIRIYKVVSSFMDLTTFFIGRTAGFIQQKLTADDFLQSNNKFGKKREGAGNPYKYQEVI